MKEKLRKYYYLFLGAIKGGTLRPLMFEINENKSLESHSYDFLIVYLKHQAHLLEKCTKNEFLGVDRGASKFERVKAILDELDLRGCKESELLSWASDVCGKYENWISQKMIQVEQCGKGQSTTDSIFDIASVRFFSQNIPSIDLIISCIENAQKASASCNRQAFKVGIIENEDIFFGEANNKSLFDKSPYRLFIFSNTSNYSEKYADAIDIGMFSQNFMLKANMLGLGSCCCYAAEHLDKSQNHYRKMFGLSREYYCYLSIVVGYPAEIAEKPPRRGVAEIINFKKTS
ncbi:nitroreductase family protein [Aliivibrio fischeri]